MNSKLEALQKSFEEFNRKVQLMENIKLELTSLNTTGFEEKTKEIRAKLSNTDLVPEIIGELKELKEKISEKEEISKGYMKSNPAVIPASRPEEPPQYHEEEMHSKSLEKDIKMLEKYGFKVKRAIRLQK
ncbi:hypothetical protein KY358_06865 [Candidatus Woesearchaeota archaeon]|nr:hypothetical protein [Candidatus Woesearchaeota archaeon]